MHDNPETTVWFAAPYVVFLGDVTNPVFAKTALGLVEWRPDGCVGQIRLAGCTVDTGMPDIDVSRAAELRARTLILGSAAIGGGVPESWIETLREAARRGLDIVAGLHVPLASLSGLADAAASGGARLVDARVPPAGLPVGTGRRRSGRRLLTVGTDCSSGKKYTALALDRELRRRGVPSDFRATGQTGIMIAGRGIPLDAVVSDFLTGAAEVLSPDAAPGHWDVIEGQGGMFHPGYLQVSVGLLVGSQPDAFVVCHDPLRPHVNGWPDYPLPSIADVITRSIAVGSLTNPGIRCVGVSLNTSRVPAAERGPLLSRHSAEHGLPCVDPLVEGTAAIVDRLLEEFP